MYHVYLNLSKEQRMRIAILARLEGKTISQYLTEVVEEFITKSKESR